MLNPFWWSHQWIISKVKHERQVLVCLFCRAINKVTCVKQTVFTMKQLHRSILRGCQQWQTKSNAITTDTTSSQLLCQLDIKYNAKCVDALNTIKGKKRFLSQKERQNHIDWRLWWKAKTNSCPLDEDGLMNGKTCQKHTITKLFFHRILTSLVRLFSNSHIYIYIWNKDTDLSHHTYKLHVIFLIVLPNSSCFIIKFYFQCSFHRIFSPMIFRFIPLLCCANLFT